jgi:hypothetical protein
VVEPTFILDANQEVPDFRKSEVVQERLNKALQDEEDPVIKGYLNKSGLD